MSDNGELIERLLDVLEAVERIPYRFESIDHPDDFVSDRDGLEHLDSICMVLIAAGEALRKIDVKTNGELRARYPQLPWSELIGIRNVIAHGYFDISHEQVFGICKEDIPPLILNLQSTISDLKRRSKK